MPYLKMYVLKVLSNNKELVIRHSKINQLYYTRDILAQLEHIKLQKH